MEGMNPVQVLRGDDRSGLLWPGDLPRSVAIDVTCAWLERNGADQWQTFAAREHMIAGDERSAAYWSKRDMAFCPENQEDAELVTVAELPPDVIPDEGQTEEEARDDGPLD